MDFYLSPLVAFTCCLTFYFYYLCFKHNVFSRFGRKHLALEYKQLLFLGICAFIPAVYFFSSMICLDALCKTNIIQESTAGLFANFETYLFLSLFAFVHTKWMGAQIGLSKISPPQITKKKIINNFYIK